MLALSQRHAYAMNQGFQVQRNSLYANAIYFPSLAELEAAGVKGIRDYPYPVNQFDFKHAAAAFTWQLSVKGLKIAGAYNSESTPAAIPAAIPALVPGQSYSRTMLSRYLMSLARPVHAIVALIQD